MTDQATRYDRIALGYATWWAPVLVPSATAILPDLDAAVDAGARRLLDVGTGTGTLAIAALRRWPDVEVIGVDLSRGMTEVAQAEAARALPPAVAGRFSVRVAPADDLPLDDGSIDAAMSSFVLQLVPNRARALREIRRVLRPGGRLAYVTWLLTDRAFAPDADLDAAFDDIDIDPREPDPRPGDIPSVEAAVAQLRRAGFADVEAEARLLEHAFDVEGYIRFVTEFDEEDLVGSFDAGTRRRFEEGLRRRLRERPADELVLRLPIVRAIGRRR